jgi:hypothetical protein
VHVLLRTEPRQGGPRLRLALLLRHHRDTTGARFHAYYAVGDMPVCRDFAACLNSRNSWRKGHLEPCGGRC